MVEVAFALGEEEEGAVVAELPPAGFALTVLDRPLPA